MSKVVDEVLQSGKYHVYPEYKDSGVDWLGNIPFHWEKSRIGFEASIKARLGWKGLKADEYVEDGYIFLATPNIKGSEIDFNNVNYITKFRYDESPEIKINVGDVLVTKDGSTTGTCNIVRKLPSPATVNSSIAVIRPIRNLVSEYLYYFFLSPYTQSVIKLMQGGMGVPHLFQADLCEFNILLPPMNEQRTIAAFLDYETARIDRLIAQQQRLIELLKEKRQAVISHAVTKGLNPNAPMKNSGIEWLGQVPEHWDICLIKYKCDDITDGAHTSPETEGGQELFVSIKDIKDGVIDFERALLTSSESYQHLVKSGCQPFAGDILFSKDGTIGQTAVTPDGISFVVASSLIIIRPNRSVVRPSFLNFLLQSCATKEQVESFVKGAALRRLSIQNLLKVFGVFPSLYEQDAISGYLETTLAHYSELESKAFQAISLMQERRTALISAAVTGKIDLRGWTPPVEEAAA